MDLMSTSSNLPQSAAPGAAGVDAAPPAVKKATRKTAPRKTAAKVSSTAGKATVGAKGKRQDQGKQAREINAMIRYTSWSVFKANSALGGGRKAMIREIEALVESLAARDIIVRGWYDVAALRADADIVLWLHAESSDALQDAYHEFRKTRLGSALTPVWSQMALHRPAEFNKSHVPAFLADEQARNYVCIYPFVRSYEWYLLDDEERRAMLVEHGQMVRDYPDVRANTVASFALGDYEWILAFEADELHRIVDLMRHLRGSKARMHVREEIPFYTGRRREVSELIRDLP